MAAHALLSPSGSSQWLNCPGSVARVQKLILDGKIPEEEDESEFATEGTLAHSLAAGSLVMGFNPKLFDDPITAAHVKSYVDYVEGFVTGSDQLHVEESVPLFYSPDDNGTVDAWIYHPADLGRGHLHVFDYKHGQGVSVDAENNTQLAIYAESLIRSPQKRDVFAGISMDAKVTMHILQPRVRVGDTQKTWTLSRRELQDFCDPIEDRAERILEGTLDEISPSPKGCRFCRAKPFCLEHGYQKMGGKPKELFIQAQETADLPSAEMLTDEEQIAIAKVNIDGGFASWMNAVTELVQSRVERGELPQSGLTVVYSNKHERWVDPEAVVKLVGRKVGRPNLFNEPKLKTPRQITQMLRQKGGLTTRFERKLKDLIEKPVGSPVLALDEDPRKPVEPLNADNEFGRD